MNRALRWGLPVFGVLVAYAGVLAWTGGARPSRDELMHELERRFGVTVDERAPFPERMRAVAERWSFAAPRRAVRIRGWEFRLCLDGVDVPAADEERVFQFVSFAENERVETGWPNGVFYDWRVRGRPATPVARLRRRLGR